MDVPNDLRYSTDHEWIKANGERRFTVGITDYAQDALGDVVFVDLPDVGASVTLGDSIGEIESTKSVSDVYAPLTGKVVEVNSELLDAPEKVNADPYGDGWMFVVEVVSDENVEGLMDAAAYAALTEG